MIDIVDIKTAVKKGHISFYIKDGIIYCKNDKGECVIVGDEKNA